MESRGFFSREALSGVPYMVAAKLILFFVYFGISILTVNGLGRDRFGVYSLLNNIASYLLILCGLGLGAALTRYVPELAAHKNRRGLIHLLCKSAALQAVAISNRNKQRVLVLANAFMPDSLRRLGHGRQTCAGSATRASHEGSTMAMPTGR